MAENTRNKRREVHDSLHSIHNFDWKIFMWLASLKEVESLIYLLIVIWNAISLNGRNNERISKELTGEISKMIRLIEELASLEALNNERKEACIKILNDYRNCRINEEHKLRNDIAHNAWVELESCGLPYNSHIFEDQLNHCALSQKESLRGVIFSRMESFHSFTKQIQTKKEAKDLSHDTTSVQDTNNISDESSEITRLKQENVRLTAQLGKVSDAEWHDGDKNNSIQLVKDIETFIRALNKITGVKRNVKEIKKDAVAELFSSLNCTTSVESKQMKLILDAALQHRLIKVILESADNYFSDVSEAQEDADKLEASILSKTEELIKLTTRFEETHTEADEHSQLLSIKLRQQSYATLGHLVFSNLNHSFINKLARDLTNEMNKYRILDSEEKNKKLEEEIITHIIQFLRIFYFRLKTQEPIPLVKFYQSGEDIDPTFMDGEWESHYEDYEVEICSFPAVFVQSDERVYTKARVIARQKNELDLD